MTNRMPPSPSVLTASRLFRPGAFLSLVALVLACSWAPAEAQRSYVVSPAGMNSDHPRISADGKVIGFIQNFAGGLAIARPDGSGHQLLGPSNTGELSLSGDGRLIAYETSAGDIFVRDMATQSSTQVNSVMSFDVVISADGTKVAFEDDGFYLWTVDPDGSNLLSMDPNGNLQADQGGPSITADGATIAFEAADYSTGAYYDIHTMSTDGTGLTRLTFDDSTIYIRARISGDGSKIAYQQYGAGLFVMDSDGSNVVSLTPGFLLGFSGETFDYHDINHDGSIAVFSASIIGVVRTDGSGLRQIDRGRTVAINGRGDVIVYDKLIGSDRRIIAAGVPGVSPGDLMDVDLSADGQTLSWATRPSANSHNVYRAAWTASGALSPAASGDCLQSAITGTTATVAGDPSVGEAYGFFVTGENGWGEGTGGMTPQGAERVPAISCPDVDSDGDAVPDVTDKCPLIFDPAQDDPDGDGLGSLCDNCPAVANPDQIDTNGNGIGNACEP